ncbi:MAG: hypothetical protein QOF62_842 [Pyrinomonadaceae bacterium]|jgi:hypothetical protein|nr:hypothetical protein [Pyrinomonadaceae bacterium]
MKTIIVLLSTALICTACSRNSVATAPGNKAAPVKGELSYTVPEGWQVERPNSNMRVAQYTLPRAEGDGADAELVVYYFGQGQGGSRQANIDRWLNQMQQSDGSPSQEKAKIENTTVNGLAVTTVDVLGKYNGGMASPGASPSATPGDLSNYRMRAAIVETPKGMYFVKLTGPQNTVSRWDQAYTGYINSFEFK